MTAPTCLITFISKIKALKLTTKIAVIIAATVIAGGVMTVIVLLNSHDEQLHEMPTTNIRQEELEETEELPFETIEEKDDTKLEGTTEVKQEGQNGALTRKFLITYEGGIEVTREKISEDVTVEPIPRIVTIGIKKPSTMSNATTPKSSQNCRTLGIERPSTCPPLTRAEYVELGGLQQQIREEHSSYKAGYYPAKEICRASGVPGENICSTYSASSGIRLCYAYMYINFTTLTVEKVWWDNNPPNPDDAPIRVGPDVNCNGINKDFPPMPSTEQLTQYLRSIAY